MRVYDLYLYDGINRGLWWERTEFVRLFKYLGEWFLDRECTVRATPANI